MTNEKTNDDIIRIASIQLHYIPAWNVNYNCLTEPSGIVNIWKNEQTFSIIKQNLPSYTGIFDAFDELLINSYLEWLNNRIKSIFGFMEKTSLKYTSSESTAFSLKKTIRSLFPFPCTFTVPADRFNSTILSATASDILHPVE